MLLASKKTLLMTENKLIIFDLDGVLIDSREMHFNALNSALIAKGYAPISKTEHLAHYDGLPTNQKLKMLSNSKGVLFSDHEEIAKLKQKYTLEELEHFCSLQGTKVRGFVSYLKDCGYYVAVASNSVRETLRVALRDLGILEFVDVYVSNEDVKWNKPFPEMYWKCMQTVRALPKNTVIIEDSHIGRQGALDSGAHLVAVENSTDLTVEKIDEAIDILEGIKKKPIPWRDKKLNVLIPMAGAGSRFAAAGYTFPKPLIEVLGKPMIQLVVENLNIEANYIYLVQKEHYEKYNLQYLLNLITPGCKIVLVNGLTEGAACTALLAEKHINNDSPLIIANSDQWVDWNSNEALYAFSAEGVDGGILTFEATHPKWSYAKIREDGFVGEVAEKKVISTEATVGIYYWKKGSDFVHYANKMIEMNDRTNNEFYIAPVFNWAINDGKKVRVKRVKEMWGIGTPEDLQRFLKEKHGL